MNDKKHAYLIMAHNNFYCLEKLLRLLDDERNDIFLHIDKKVNSFDFEYFRKLCKKARVLYPKRRLNVSWGTDSQIKCEMLLFQTAAKHGTYHYYHLLSGVDLPLVSQERIHNFFDGRSECFLQANEILTNYDYQRLSRYHINFSNKLPFHEKLKIYFGIIQTKLNVDRIKKLKGMTIKRGANWASLPHSAVLLLLKKKRWIFKTVRFSVCADEMYKQLVLMNSDEVLYKDGESYVNLRLVDWARGTMNHPYTFTSDDFKLLTEADAFFARKFDEKTDKKIIDMIYDYVKAQGD